MESGEALVREGHPATVLVLDEVRREREVQDVKWGVQRRPSLDPVLLKRPGGADEQRLADEYEVPSATRAKATCEAAFARGQGTWGHILVEEVAEVIACGTDETSMREELLQVAAVAVAWVEDLDRRNPR